MARSKEASTLHTFETQSDSASTTSSTRPTSGVPGYVARLFEHDRLDRKLKRHHITSIAFSGTVGIGLFVTSGELIGIAGSAGSVIAFAVAGIVIVCVMRTLAELVSVRPLSGALIDYPHTFVDPALGFAVGVMYWLAQCLCMATLTAAAARVGNNFVPSGQGLTSGQKAGILGGLFVITLLSNALGVKIYGRLERAVKWLKIMLIIALCVLMIIINVGVGGHTFGSTNYTQYALVPSLRWEGFNGSSSTGPNNAPALEIPGDSGRFLAIWTCITLAMFACMGGDYVVVTAGEAESPRRDLPIAARFMYLVPISCYILASFLAGFNVNYMDPHLFHPWASANSSASNSPFIIALGYTTIKVLPTFLNGCFLFSAYTTGNTCLYISSRTLFAISQLYGNNFIKETLGKTNSGHTPMAAIIFCSLFGFLAFLGLADTTYNQPILTLSAFFTGTVACIYASECLAFLRFKAGLKRLENHEIFSRDDDLYRQQHYRAHWQPLCAIFGLVACVLIVLFSGWPAIYLLRVGAPSTVKPTSYLIADVVGAYVGPVLFIVLYVLYKLIYKTRLQSLRDFENAYFLPEFDDEPRAEVPKGWRGVLGVVWSLIR
ncbi:Cationic amino acid transporter 2 [Xylographa opegraphella]|nr:Cationic amino acid transporter 2 [Xylographa opegraphella]